MKERILATEAGLSLYQLLCRIQKKDDLVPAFKKSVVLLELKKTNKPDRQKFSAGSAGFRWEAMRTLGRMMRELPEASP